MKKISSEKLERVLWRECRETGTEVLYNRYTSALETQRHGLFLHVFLVAKSSRVCCVSRGGGPPAVVEFYLMTFDFQCKHFKEFSQVNKYPSSLYKLLK